MDKKKIMALMLATSAGAGAIIMQDGKIAHADNYKNKDLILNRSANKGRVINVTTSLRVRESASTSSKIIGHLHNGNEVTILGKSGSWYKIDFKGKNGYVHEDYIKENSTNSGSSFTGKGKVVNVSSSLRIRSGAGTEHSVIGYLNEGNVFDIIGRSGSWYKINHNGRDGYVHKDYVEEIKGNSSNDKDENLSEKGHVVNISSNLRIRSGASTNHSVVGYLSNGDSVDIIGKSGSWYKIKAKGHTGYVSAEYIKIGSASSNNGNSGNSGNYEENISSRGEVINITSNLRIRNAPNTTSSVIGYLLNGDTFDIVGKSGSWYKIKHNGNTGYVHSDYVKIIKGNGGSESNNGNSSGNSGSESLNEYGKVINVSTSLRLRKGPSTNTSVVGYLYPGETFKITERQNGWYKINANGKIGYVSSDYVKIIDKEEGESHHGSATFEKVFTILKQQIGSPYIWGGKGELITTDSLNWFKRTYPSEAAAGKYDIPSKYINSGYRAFDCSGLLYWGFKQVGINIGGSTYDQINAGREVSLNDVRPGDLLFYGSLHHVGMYIGDGKWIESPKSHDYVKIASVPWSRIGRARRVLN